MAIKKPSLATQLKNANAKIAELEKKIKDGEWQVPHYKRSAEEATSELEQIHAFFDVLPGAIPRKIPTEYSSVNNAAMTRLASWLATRGNGQ